MEVKKHIGRIINTDRRCIVVFMSLPGREDHALVVDTDALPDRIHDALMDVVESKEAQQEIKLGNVLSRRLLPDFGMDILNVLHQRGSLIPMPVSNIMMYPIPNQPIPLSELVKYGQVRENPNVEVAEHKYENLVADHESNKQEVNINVARNLLIEADMLEQEANFKREKAYTLAPSLRKVEPKKRELTIDEKLEIHMRGIEESALLEEQNNPKRGRPFTGGRERTKSRREKKAKKIALKESVILDNTSPVEIEENINESQT